MFSRETLALMDAAVDAIVVIDHRGHITAVNDSTCRTFGYRTDELLGENVSMLMPEPDRGAHDGYVERFLSSGVARIIGIGREVTARRKDGTSFPARLSVGRVADAVPARFVGLLRDMTEEHERLTDLKLERDRARAYLDLSESILVELDAEQRVREVNPRGSELMGAPAQEFLGVDWTSSMCGDAEREQARLLLANALSSGSQREREFDCLAIDGTPRRIHWRCVALRSAAGAPAGWLCSGNDVTDQVEREQSLHLAQDRLTRVARLATLGEMTAGIAHELNQPLAAITTYARACERYLGMTAPDVDEMREAVREINAEGLRAGEIIRRLRRMTRAGAPDEHALVEVSSLIEELRSLMQSDARAHEARLHIAIEPDLSPVNGSAVQLQQVILNLLRNALEALLECPAGSREVTVSAARAIEGDVEIRVTDNGPGIDVRIRDSLFDPFSTTKASGTGLGLAISRTIVEGHRGTIGARPAQPRGTTFYVRLPVMEEIAR